jgi:DNA polymerase-1
MLSGFAEEIITRAIREGVVLYPGANVGMLHFEAYERRLAPDLRALLLEHKPAILAVLSAGGIQSLRWGFAPAASLVVDGVTVVICQTIAEAEACIGEMIRDAAGKPVALDLETAPLASEIARLATLEAERTAINAAAIAARKAAKKAAASVAEIEAITAEAAPRLKDLDLQIAYAESAGLDPHRAEIRLAQVYGGGARVAVIDMRKAGLAALRALEGVSAVIHNAPFDLAFLDLAGVDLSKVHDTQQAARLTLGASKCGFAQAVKSYCKVELDKELQASDWASEELSEAQFAYAVRDVIWLWRLCPPLFADLKPQVSAYKIQIAAAPAIARMNNAGITLDLDAHAGAMAAFAEIDETASAAYRDACIEIGKPGLAGAVPDTAAGIQGLLSALLTDVELADWKRTAKTGALATGKAALQMAAHYPPIPPLIELTTLKGLRSSFGDSLRYLVNPTTGRVHPHYQLCGARSGRSTTREPNLQGTPRDLRVRALFRAADGKVLYAADYHCMELRAAGLFFNESALNAVFDRGADPHTITASHVTGKPIDAVSDEERNRAKNANFGALYGIGPASLAWQIWKNYKRRVSLADAENLLAVFEGLYPTMIAHRREYAQACQLRRAIIIGTGWREGKGRIVPLAHLPPDQSPTTCAYSYPIQGICADAAMMAIVDLDQRLREQNIEARIIGWIHDELIVEGREADGDRIKGLLKDTMERAFLAVFPQATLLKLVEVKSGLTWAALKQKVKKEEEQSQ